MADFTNNEEERRAAVAEGMYKGVISKIDEVRQIMGKDLQFNTSQQASIYEAVMGGLKNNLDAVLAEHGYVREGDFYRAERPNRDTIVFFCHFGMECVLLSHLMNTSPMILWHHLCAAPSSVTTVYTEERCPGKAIFRVSAFGDISHLYAGGEEPSFMARFCETYHDTHGERRDD